MKRILAAAAAALMTVTAPPAFAEEAVTVTAAAASLAPNRYVWAADGDTVAGPVSIVISIADQRAYVYRGETMVAATSVSTGKDGKDTPIGTFTILQKEETHKSNLYDDAPMPFMQRLTWDGVAIHAGKNPGFPASHGCVRVPTAFAKRLFAITSLGTPVLVTDASEAEGWTLPQPYDAEAMSAETAAANKGQMDVASR